MDQETRKKLSKSVETFKKPGAGGRQFSYIKGEDVIGRLNTAFKHDWSSRVVNSWVTEDKIKQVIVLVEITAGGVAHQGYGGAEIAVYSNGARQGDPVDVSNSWKSALTNAIKNSAKHFGIGLLTDETDTDFSETVNAPSVSVASDVKPVISVTTSTAPVAGNGTISISNEEKKNEQVSKILAAAGVKTNPNPPSSLAENFKDNATPTPNTNTESPFKPSTTEAVNDVQVGAMVAMSKLKSIDPAKAIEDATGSNDKKDFKELSSEEARKVIKHLHTAPKGA